MKIIVATIVSAMLFISPFAAVYAQEEQKDEDPIVVVSNLTSNSFTINWFTNAALDHKLYMGKTEQDLKPFEDIRGAGRRSTHSVTMKNLHHDTEYFFKINNQSKLHRQKTAKDLSTVAPFSERFMGNVYNEDNQAPIEAIVFLKVEGGTLLSSVTNSQGQWQIKTANARTNDLSNYLQVEGTNYVDLFVRSGIEGETGKKVFAYAREHPIDFDLIEPRVPFYKVILPGLIVDNTVSSTVVASASPTSAPASVNTASDDGFFETIWARVRDIF